MSEKTKTYGIQPKKPRSLDEINVDYNKNAVECGHKQRVVYQIEQEIQAHIERLIELNEEASKLKNTTMVPTPQTEAPETQATASGAV